MSNFIPSDHGRYQSYLTEKETIAEWKRKVATKESELWLSEDPADNELLRTVIGFREPMQSILDVRDRLIQGWDADRENSGRGHDEETRAACEILKGYLEGTLPKKADFTPGVKKESLGTDDDISKWGSALAQEEDGDNIDKYLARLLHYTVGTGCPDQDTSRESDTYFTEE